MTWRWPINNNNCC